MDKERKVTSLLASSSTPSGSKLLRDIVPHHAYRLVDTDHSDEELNDIISGPGHDCCLGLLGLFGAGLEGDCAWFGQRSGM